MEFIKNCFKGLYDFKVYKELMKASKLKVFLYVVILSAVLGGILSVPFYNNSRSSVNVVENNMDKIPEFTVKNNNLQLKNEGPVVINDSGMVLIFDDSTDNNSDYAKAENAIFWGKSCLKKKLNGKELGSAKYADSKGITLNKQYVIDEAKSYKFMPIRFIIQNIAISYMLIFMAALLVMTFSMRAKNPMQFGEIFKISSFTVTVPIILFTCLKAFGIGNMPIISWILVIIQVLYVRKAIKEVNDEDSLKPEYKIKKTNKK